MAVDADVYRAAMASYPTGVTIVTARDRNGRPLGFTCNAFCSISLAPPMVLISVALTSSTLPAIVESRAFTVNVLAEGNATVAARFAGKSDLKFHGMTLVDPVQAASGPILADHASAFLICSVHRLVPCCDHILVIGDVEAADSVDRQPLLFHRRSYAGLRAGGDD